MRITARARRARAWWAVEVPEVPGAFTQTKRLDEVATAAAETVADLLEGDAASIKVDVEADLPDTGTRRPTSARRSVSGMSGDQNAVAAMVHVLEEIRDLLRASSNPAPARIAVTRKEAAQMLGVSSDTIRAAKNSGRLKAKAVSLRGDGKVTKELYSVDDLRAWFDSLGPA